MVCNCKLCKSGLSETVNTLAQSQSIEGVLRTLQTDYDLQLNSYTLKKHFETCDIEYWTVADKAPSIEVETEGRYHQPIDITSLSLDRWGLTMSDPSSIVTVLQEKLLCLVFLQYEIVASQMLQYVSGANCIEPSKDSIGNLRVLTLLADKFTAISLQANQQQAVRIVESLGYESELISSSQASQ